MEKKLSRLEVIQYCNKCKHVKKSSGSTLCGLTNQMAMFDYVCDKFADKNSPTAKSEKSFFGSWQSALVLSILGFLRFALKLGSGKMDIFGLIFLVLGVGWLLFALFGNKE